MPRKATKKESPALHLIRFAYDQVKCGKSRDQYRFAMGDIIRFAVAHGLRFDIDDIHALHHQVDKVWGGRRTYSIFDGCNIEWLYALACGENRGQQNMSAALSIEKFLGRKPFLVRESPRVKTPTRVYVGFQFAWYSVRVKCTSFNDSKGSLIACTYKPRETDERGYPIGPEKIDKRHTINHEHIRVYHAWLKARPEEAEGAAS